MRSNRSAIASDRLRSIIDRLRSIIDRPDRLSIGQSHEIQNTRCFSELSVHCSSHSVAASTAWIQATNMVNFKTVSSALCTQDETSLDWLERTQQPNGNEFHPQNHTILFVLQYFNMFLSLFDGEFIVHVGKQQIHGICVCLKSIFVYNLMQNFLYCKVYTVIIIMLCVEEPIYRQCADQ